MKERTIYLLSERGNFSCCKIGKNSDWPFRYHKAQSHNPRGLDVIGAWHFGCSLSELNELECLAQRDLPKLSSRDVNEWYSVSAEKALEIITKRFNRQPDVVDNPGVKPYDDWRKKSDKVKGNVYKRRIWVNVEDTPDLYIKVSHSIFYDTYYSYKFTYNFRDIWLVTGFEWPINLGGPADAYSVTNQYVEDAWTQATEIFGNGPDVETVGWLKKRTNPAHLKEFFISKGLIPFDVRGPKPQDCLPRDPECNASFQVGKVPSSSRLSNNNYGF